MSTTHSVDGVADFIAAVRDRLSDVPEEERAELLDDVAAHVREVADEFGTDQLHERLGTPEAFSDELRASAGYAPAEPAETPAADSLGALRRWVRSTRNRVDTPANREVWRKLEPGWFVLRGVFLGYVVLSMTGADASVFPRLGNSQLLGFVVLAAGAVLSFKIGERRREPRNTLTRRLTIGGQVALVLFAFVYLGDASQTRTVFYDSGNTSYDGDGCLRDSAQRPISNLYAFDSQGQLIPQVFLTDQKGRPIDNLCPDQVDANEFGPAKTVYATDKNGAPVYNVFPREQLQLRPDATGREMQSEPVNPPAVVFPQLSTTTTTVAASSEVQPQP